MTAQKTEPSPTATSATTQRRRRREKSRALSQSCVKCGSSRKACLVSRGVFYSGQFRLRPTALVLLRPVLLRPSST